MMTEEELLAEELETFEPETLTLERMQELYDSSDEIETMARDGQFGFQILMMHPVGHVQMAYDIKKLTEFWLKYREEV
jgi:hypothetical protein